LPYTDAYGRTISDDGRLVWDGRTWQPLAVPAPAAGGPALRPGGKGRSVWGIVAAVVVISLIAILALAGLGFYALVRSPSYGNGYASSYQEQRAADEAAIASDLAACRSSATACDRTRLRTDIRRERSQVAGLAGFPFTPPCLQPEMRSQLSTLDAMNAAAGTSAGDAQVAAGLDQLARLRGGNPCPG
jgi:hypothetical protein